MKKSQVSMEYLFVFGFIFILVAAAFSSVWVYYKKTKNINDAEEASAMLAKTANAIYGLGTGSKKKVIVSFPSNVEDIIVQNNEITFVLNDNGKLKNYTAYSNAPLVKGDIAINTRVDGGLPTTGMGYTQAPRRLEISVQKLCNGSVMIGTGTDNCGSSGSTPTGKVIFRTNATQVSGEDYLDYTDESIWIVIDTDLDGSLDVYKHLHTWTGLTAECVSNDLNFICNLAELDKMECNLTYTPDGNLISMTRTWGGFPPEIIELPRICDLNIGKQIDFELETNWPNINTSTDPVPKYADYQETRCDMLSQEYQDAQPICQ